ncbi:hypothetical protein Q5762_26970 [Streptomyces sp. P9(2023)]|nr:hypothetical protein [Streptomyces sp. P9(2023)]MDT9691908.1 hypothetical protein [Streptomyces sp. P9(2023)]
MSLVRGRTHLGELGKITREENRLEERLAELRARKSAPHPGPRWRR